jgi:transcriptional regulator with XRE-family HTH domain
MYFLQYMEAVEIELQRQIKTQLESRKKSGMAVSEIAARLGVKPATVYQLMEGHTTPNSRVLCNSCRNLGMSYQINGCRIGAIDFPQGSQQEPVKEFQLGLFGVTASADGNELNLTVKKASASAIELGVRLAG